jgi:hypothetical protein
VRNGAPASDADTNEENDENTARDEPVNSSKSRETVPAAIGTVMMGC